MKIITKYKTEDGSEFDTEEKALAHEVLIKRVLEAMQPLYIPAEINKQVENGKGWYQHDLAAVYAAREAILELARPIHAKFYPAFNSHGSEVHPMSIIGRVLSDGPNNDPIGLAWNRFMRIDPSGREHQQCYYAYTAGPTPDQVRLNP